ncbi:MAG: tRNA-dihydrouridine synthase, partial [Bacteroidales bacterium]
LLMRNRYGIDGILIGRAAIGNPWIFEQIQAGLRGENIRTPDLCERIAVCKEHLAQSILWKGEIVGVLEMKKHYSGYFKGIENFKPIKMLLMESKEQKEVEALLSTIANRSPNILPA